MFKKGRQIVYKEKSRVKCECQGKGWGHARSFQVGIWPNASEVQWGWKSQLEGVEKRLGEESKGV